MKAGDSGIKEGISKVDEFFKELKKKAEEQILRNSNINDTHEIPKSLLEEIRKRTENLPVMTLHDMIESKNGRIVRFEVENGECWAEGILAEDGVAVVKAFNSKGVKFERHLHREKEWLIIYKGKATVTINGKVFKMGVGDSVYLEPDQPHKVEYHEDTWLVAVTIPRGEGFPDAE